MTNLIIEISKYFMIFMFAFYTYECFAAFRQKIKPEQREHILSRQCAAVFLIHFDAFAVIYLVTEDISILVFYAAQAALLAMIQTCYQLFYSRSSRLLTNNLCMLLTIGFIMLTRLSFDSARKQYFIALVSMIFSLIIPVLINRVGFVRKLYWLFAIVGILALLVVTIAGNTSYGAKISLSIAGISIQPSEFVKILFVFFVAGMLYQDTSFQRVCDNGDRCDPCADSCGIPRPRCSTVVFHDLCSHALCCNEKSVLFCGRTCRRKRSFCGGLPSFFPYPCEGESVAESAGIYR